MREIRASVVIATLGRPGPLERVLASLRSAQPAPAEVIVVDGGTDSSAQPVVDQAGREAPYPIRYHQVAPGLTRQRNAGLGMADGDVVVFLDDDAVPAPDALGLLLAAYADPTVVGATARIVEPASNRVGGKTSASRRLLPGGGREGQFTRFGYPRRLVDEQVARDVEFMAGCCMSARLEVARQVGFDERLPGYALAEDEDFSYRLSRHGVVRYVPAAVVRHENSGFGSRDRREFGRQVVRNRRYLFAKNFPQTPLARVQFHLLLLVLLAHRLLNRDLAGFRGLAEEAVHPQPLTGRGAA